MQTFLPYSDFRESAKILDRQRLGKQRVETRQILECLYGIKDGWKNHPAVKMWKNHEDWLVKYGIEICLEWQMRGYKDNQFDIIYSFFKNANQSKPFWLGDERFHSAHRQTLLSKNFDWYSQFRWKEEPKYEYWWPTQNLI